MSALAGVGIVQRQLAEDRVPPAAGMFSVRRMVVVLAVRAGGEIVLRNAAYASLGPIGPWMP